VRFWDSSAIVSLVLDEAVSEAVRQVFNEDRNLVVWWATPVECVSALHRRERMATLGPGGLDFARQELHELLEDDEVVLPNDAIRDRALRALAVHPLTAADAFQLAAALVRCGDRPRGVAFVTVDDRMRQAAAREGFRVLP
jgi:predicted nucleic acid-binding protein